MTLSVWLGSQNITKQVSALKLASSSPGGFESVEFDIARRLDQALIDASADVLVYDAATGEQVGGGRIDDQGRKDDGRWSVSCIGEGFASMTDRTEPYVLVDKSLDSWFQNYAPNNRFKAQPGQDSLQYGVPDAGLVFTVEAGNWAIGRFVRADYPLLNRSGQLLGGLILTTKASVNDAGPRTQVLFSNPFAGGTVYDAAWSTSSTQLIFVAGTHFPADRSVPDIQINAAAGGMGGGDAVWLLAYGIAVVAQRLDKNRAAITGSTYASGKVTIDQAFIDMVARFCPRLDLTTASIDVGTYQFDQLAWFDGISPKAAIEDMLGLEPTFAWHVWGKGPAGWQTELVQYPTTVRYEASTADGYQAPTPFGELYNSVDVRWKDVIGQTQVTTVTSYVQSLAEAGVTRSTVIDLADEVGSASQAVARGTAFLQDHAVPPNAGTLIVARRIYDYSTNRWVRPWNIRPGSLIRVRGIQPTPDTLNTTSPDGVTVFRIVGVSYEDETRTATLALDTYALDQQQAIAELYKRGRKR
jgi:hypothetical protein